MVKFTHCAEIEHKLKKRFEIEPQKYINMCIINNMENYFKSGAKIPYVPFWTVLTYCSLDNEALVAALPAPRPVGLVFWPSSGPGTALQGFSVGF
jgi:hypothetical protein